uniref:Myb-like domain-containing protein n=1 Tax=Brassica oleracea var. oleracea TaxID=109376 RepID=A0A0D3AMY5_BRAOL
MVLLEKTAAKLREFRVGLAAWETVKENRHTSEMDKCLAGSSKIRITCHQSGSNLSTDASVFGTQWAEDATEEEHVMSDRKERRNWSPTEDIVLISAWLNTSKDPVVGNDQKAIAFWKRIAAYVAYSPKLFALQKREPSHCKQRWGKINESVCKFVGCYEAAMKAKASGMSEDDVLKMVHELFFNDYKVKFTLEHAWLELRHDQKWCGASSTKDKDDIGSRPVGVKAAKAKGKRSISKPALEEEEREFQSFCKIRQQDFALKDQLNKHKLLDSLIAKTEPLSELEIALKNKLITDMLA